MDDGEQTVNPFHYTEEPVRKPLPEPTEAWFDLAWRPAGSRSLADRWLKAGEPAPRPPAKPRVTRRTSKR